MMESVRWLYLSSIYEKGSISFNGAFKYKKLGAKTHAIKS